MIASEEYRKGRKREDNDAIEENLPVQSGEPIHVVLNEKTATGICLGLGSATCAFIVFAWGRIHDCSFASRTRQNCAAGYWKTPIV
jgi:hypothetical protein